MALSRTAPSPGSTGWFPVARAADVGTTPLAVGAGGRPWVVVRLRPAAEVTALSARCPHRLVPLTAGSVVGGRLRCASHGWEFNAEGRCVDVPTLGADGTPPPRADLATPWAVEERDGWVWIAPDRTLHTRPPRAVAGTSPEPVPPLPEPAGPVLGNLDAVLEHAWHPVALSDELREGGWLAVRLLGRTWTVERDAGVLTAGPSAWSVREHGGVVWLAPAEPHGADAPLSDDGVRSAWLSPVRTSAVAGLVADAVLDPGQEPDLETEVHAEEGGFTGLVRSPAGSLLATHVVRTPFQLLTRRPDRTVLVLLQPEDADSTRVYTRVLVPGATRAGLAAAAREEQALRDRHLALLERTAGPGLPLTPRDELHLRSDRLGVALRRVLADAAAATRSAEQDPGLEEDTDVAA